MLKGAIPILYSQCQLRDEENICPKFIDPILPFPPQASVILFFLIVTLDESVQQLAVACIKIAINANKMNFTID